MDVLKLTEKDLFKLRLNDEPIVMDATDVYNKWATPEQYAHLKKLGVVEQNESGVCTITHRIKVREQSRWQEEPHWVEIEKGTILSSKPRPDRQYS